MTIPPIIPSRGKTGDFVIATPRATDAVGLALRGVFDGAAALPDDMAAALARIDCVTAHR